MERLLPLKNAVNLRELGEYPAAGGVIAPHKLLRSGSLSQLTAKEAEWLQDYGLKTVIDLRTDNEVAGSPDVVAPGVKWQQLSVYPFADAMANGSFTRHLAAMADRRIDPMAEAYLRMLTDSHAIKVFQQVFALLLANDQP
ncbi:MAG: tyrosine-protein phosphatase, partial [Lactobacillus sp.]|nr:tyrosine-protein phosphatase [Lactobacillus sp.]